MKKKVVVIGAGIAGLSTGCYAAMNGYEVELLEARGQPGGLCTSWKRGEYTIDGSLHWLTGSGPGNSFHQVWRELGAVQGRRMYDRDIFTRVSDASGRSLLFFVDADRLERHLKEIAPEDAGPIEELCAAARRMAGFGLPPGKPTELMGPIEGLRVMRYYMKRMPDLKYLLGTRLADFAGRFTNPFARKCIKNMFYGMEDVSLFPLVMPMGPISRKAGGFPEGGSLEFAKAIEGRFLGLGGKASYGERALRLVEEGGKAVGVVSNGREVPADFVVSCADLRWSLESLLGGRHRSEAHDELFAGVKLIEPSIMVSFGVDMDFSDRADAMSEVFELDAPFRAAGREYAWLNCHSYSFDPSFAPKGKSLVATILMTDYEYWDRLRADSGAYIAEKESIARACARALDRRFPGFASRIEMTDVATPLTFERYTGDWKGAYMTWTLSPEYRKKHREVPKRVPGLSGFYLASMWTNPPGGVPAAASAGRQAVQLLCADDRKRFRTSVPGS